MRLLISALLLLALFGAVIAAIKSLVVTVGLVLLIVGLVMALSLVGNGQKR